MKRGTEKGSAERRETAVKMKASGVPTREIAHCLGVTCACVQYYLSWERKRGETRPNGMPYFKKAAA